MGLSWDGWNNNADITRCGWNWIEGRVSCPFRTEVEWSRSMFQQEPAFVYVKREIISQIMHTTTQTSRLQGFWKLRVGFHKTLKALFKGINWEGVVQEITLGGLSFFHFSLNIQYIHESKRSLNWGLITLQTTPPPSLSLFHPLLLTGSAGYVTHLCLAHVATVIINDNMWTD